MSKDQDKLSHSRRIWQKIRHIVRQMSIRKAHSFPIPDKDGHTEIGHRYHKKSGVTCGDSNCVMCGNPRKFFKERTQQEKRQMQDVDRIRDKRSNGVPPRDE